MFNVLEFHARSKGKEMDTIQLVYTNIILLLAREREGEQQQERRSFCGVFQFMNKVKWI